MSDILAIGPLGTPELIIIFIAILLLFGAKKLPELARGVGKSLGEFKKARQDFEEDLLGTDKKPAASGEGSEA